MKRILIVEDDTLLNKTLAYNLGFAEKHAFRHKDRKERKKSASQ